MLKLQKGNIINNCKIGFRSKLSKKLYSQVYDSIVKLSDNVSNNEIKVPAYGNNYSIYFKQNESLSDVEQRVIGTDEKIVKVEFLDNENKKIEDVNKMIGEVVKDPFRLRINNYMIIKYFPSVNMLIADQSGINNVNSKSPSNSSLDDKIILNNYNFFLYQALIKGKTKLSTTKSEVESRLNSLLSIYQQMEKEYLKAEELLSKRYEKTKRNYIWLALLFFTAHTILFYVLIYQLYGWDTIEPITYLVGNVYWIAGLLFFIMKKKKLDVSFFFSGSFRKNFYSKNAKNLGFSEVEKNFIRKEILEIQQFKEALVKF